MAVANFYMHHVYALMLDGKLHQAPIPPDVKRVLDIGTGTGKWAVDFGDMYPSASVIGTDLSPIQPSFVPPNVSFEIDDCCDEWLFPQPFDLIHIRGLFGCVADWDKLYNQALQHLQQGGYIEQLETTMLLRSDDGSADGTVMREFQQLGLESSAKFGKSLNTAEEMKAGIIKAGFVDVTEHSFKLPVGSWPKDRQLKALGRYQRLVWEESIEMWSMMLLTKVLRWSREKVDAYLMHVRKDLRNQDIHSYQDVRVCYGRKPTAEESAQATA
ncbi:hypothetical protein PHISP_01308 [Aspergillus sp. HF37]|nr:hypothetical protein PHISP_01308 [Aspergillus sp. HF37]